MGFMKAKFAVLIVCPWFVLGDGGKEVCCVGAYEGMVDMKAERMKHTLLSALWQIDGSQCSPWVSIMKHYSI